MMNAVSTLRARKQHEIRAEDARDRARGADVRDARALRAGERERHDGLRQRRGDPRCEVPEQEPEAAEHVLDVVPEDPEEDHVPGEVQQLPCMNIDVKTPSHAGR
jgi:hypothetical protein